MSTNKNILLIGDTEVDKSDLLKHVEAQTTNVHQIRLNIWDIGGKDKWDSIRKEYYKYADGAVIIFDVANNRSYNNVPKWYNEIQEARPDIPIAIVANKSHTEIPVKNTDDPWIWLARKLE
jgi:small GTP-binding protein